MSRGGTHGSPADPPSGQGPLGRRGSRRAARLRPRDRSPAARKVDSMTVIETRAGLNDEQLAAVEMGGTVFVSAGAGTGKTSVLVERYVRAVCERGLDVDSILVITYTRKAAGELRSRIRAALVERDRPDLARELDGAWISTIHGFCNRLLKAHPFAVGSIPASASSRTRARRPYAERRSNVPSRRFAPVATRAVAAARDVSRGRTPAHAHRGLRDAALGGSSARVGTGRTPRARGRDRRVPHGSVMPRR